MVGESKQRLRPKYRHYAGVIVDVFYDHKVKLIMSAECPPDELYTEGPMSGEFHRTVSRLIEMQSHEYLQSDRREVATL